MNAVTRAQPRTSRSGKHESTAGTSATSDHADARGGQRSKHSRAKAKRPTPGMLKPSKRARPLRAPGTNLARPSKQGQLTALLVRDEGATIAQMTDATGWLPHTVRAALTGLRKKGYSINSDRVDGVRTYRAMAPE